MGLFWSGFRILLCFVSLYCGTIPASILTVSPSFIDCFKFVLPRGSDSLPLAAFSKYNCQSIRARFVLCLGLRTYVVVTTLMFLFSLSRYFHSL